MNIRPIEQFESGEAYYASLFHELVHATGHGSRLGREEVMNPQKFGSQPYSREELVAEMGASFLCSTVLIDYDGIAQNSASYLAGWLNVLKADSQFIFKAAAEAQKAADYILNRHVVDRKLFASKTNLKTKPLNGKQPFPRISCLFLSTVKTV